MPRVNDYGNPEVESSLPLEVSNQRIEEAGQLGRAVKDFGNVVNQAADAHYQRAAQEEVSNAQVQFATARADWSGKLNQQIREGTVDVDQLKSEYQDYVDNNSDNYQTAHGKQIYQQQAARTGSMLIRNAMHAQAALAGEKAKANWTAALDHDSSTLYNNPENFPDLLESNHADIDAQVETGAIPAARADEIKHKVGQELAKSAVRGWAQIDPDKAQHMLDQGAFDNYFNGDTKSAMQGYINSQKSAKYTEDLRTEKIAKDAQKANAEKWKSDRFTQLENNTLSVKDVEKAVNDGTLTYEDAKEQVGMINANAKRDLKTDYRLKNMVTQKVASGDITDPSDVRAYAGKGLSIHDVNEITGMIDKTPEGQAANSNRKAMFNVLSATARFKDPMTGQNSAIGEAKLGQAKSDLLKAEQQMRKEGKPVSALYDPTSPDYFGAKANKYATPMGERFQTGVQQMRQDAVATPSGETKTPEARQPGETPAQWMKRLGR